MGAELLRRMFNRGVRKCNMGDCPAFTFTDEQWEKVESKSHQHRRRKAKGEQVNPPLLVGTCKAKRLIMSVNSPCAVRDADFDGYFRQLYEKK